MSEDENKECQHETAYFSRLHYNFYCVECGQSMGPDYYNKNFVYRFEYPTEEDVKD